MDMSLFIIDYELMEIQFAGAHNPLYIIRNTNGLPSNQLEEYSGDDLSIGSYEKSYESFTNLHIPINKGDLLYLFSDGYYDQFGGEDSKKLSKDNFKNVLINNAWLPLEQQKFRLEKTLLNWRGNYEQIDDITVIGVRI